jgi:4'-phosphopantetheinyl transferase
VILVGAIAGFRLQRDISDLTRTRIRPKHAPMRLLSASDFIPARYPLPLGAAEIHLWFFPAPRRRDAIGAGDARARSVLAAYLGCAPDALRLATGAHGKPFLTGASAFDFNISHSGGALLVGIARDQALGVDIETQRRTRPVLDLARRFFAAEEAAALAGLDERLRQIAFLRLWSCKEAVVKALGNGIGFGLARLQFGIDATGEPNALSVIHASAGAPPDWHIIRLAPTGAHVGALAWRGPARQVRAFVATAD